MIMQYVEGYASNNIEYCPFCGSRDTWWMGGHECRSCGKRFHIIEDDPKEQEEKEGK